MRVEDPREATTSGRSSGVRQMASLKRVAVCRDRERGVVGRRDAPGEKVLEDRRSPRERGRMGTSQPRAAAAFALSLPRRSRRRRRRRPRPRPTPLDSPPTARKTRPGQPP
eukprot:29442-Pelagococcus_subviridis.AAC.2